MSVGMSWIIVEIAAADCQTKKKLFTQLKTRVKGIRLETPGGSVVQQMVETVTVAEFNAVNKMLLKK